MFLICLFCGSSFNCYCKYLSALSLDLNVNEIHTIEASGVFATRTEYTSL